MGARSRNWTNGRADARGLVSMANVGIALLAVVTLVLVALALRDQEPATADASSPATSGTRPSGGASPPTVAGTAGTSSSTRAAPSATGTTVALLAGADDALWRWIGPRSCAAGVASGTLARSSDGATWTPVTAPGSALSWLDAASASVATATVFDAACAASVVATSDGGATWEPLDASGTLSRVSLGRPDGRWALRDGDVVREVDEVFAAPAAKPCVGTDVSAPSVISALSSTVAYVVCQASDGSGRLLTRTRDGGASWTRLAGKRAETGLHGVGVIASLHMANASRGAVLMQAAACDAGEVRVTADGGLRWTALPCITVGGSEVKTVLDVVVRGDGSFVAAALTAAGSQMLTSADGTAWTQIGER